MLLSLQNDRLCICLIAAPHLLVIIHEWASGPSWVTRRCSNHPPAALLVCLLRFRAISDAVVLAVILPAASVFGELVGIAVQQYQHTWERWTTV